MRSPRERGATGSGGEPRAALDPASGRAATNDRRLEALGFTDVPAERPLSYPGRPVTEPSLLTGPELLPLRVGTGRLGGWRVVDAYGPYAPAAAREPALDEALAALGAPPCGERRPVLAVGSNASPAQLRHKLTRCARSAVVPLVPVRVRGVSVGCSAHIGVNGYVAAAPFAAPEAVSTLVLGWLDAGQLAAVDATEHNYRRVLLPGDAFPVELPSGERLDGAYLYVSRHGVLADPADPGRPRPAGGQRALLASLLAASPALRALLGADPESWVARARADEAVRAAGKRIFGELGWTLPVRGFPGATAPPSGQSSHIGNLP
ncbi:hypothetical protein ACFP1Z_14275 [Streptomyces gamaensis]|uniref:Uncharacterized protein n=1 Tax=Streptomyces gamaensis TaxID=1763542 RepID=A0ABW0Z4M1_9ACTN